jgi:hypothetical protein
MIPAAMYYYSLSKPQAAQPNLNAPVNREKLVGQVAQAKVGVQVVRAALV